jgi:hypothetical protein
MSTSASIELTWKSSLSLFLLNNNNKFIDEHKKPFINLKYFLELTSRLPLIKQLR